MRVRWNSHNICVRSMRTDADGYPRAPALHESAFTCPPHSPLKRVGNTIKLRAKEQHNQFSAQPEQWILSNDETGRSIRRQYWQSLQDLVFQRSTRNTN